MTDVSSLDGRDPAASRSPSMPNGFCCAGDPADCYDSASTAYHGSNTPAGPVRPGVEATATDPEEPAECSVIARLPNEPPVTAPLLWRRFGTKGGLAVLSDRSATPATELSRAKPSTSWLDLAACREVDPEIFFPISMSEAAQEQVREAQAICARCPVGVDCLDWALRSGQGHGVWGGTTPEERRALRTIGHRPR